jgi:TolB-like protein/Tfp pilus assembly protein PilF
MEYLGDGLAEEILNLLAKLNELNVAARTSSFYFKNKDVDIKEIGSRLGVGHVLEGSVRHQSGKVRVTAQLIDSSNGFHLWSETYDREASDLLALQDEIAGQVVETLQILLSTESRETLSSRGFVDPLAYDYYLRGQSYLRLPMSESNVEFAVELLGKAVDSNPEYADAYAGLCNALLGLYSMDLDPDNFERAEVACHRALTLDRRAATVYIALGNLYRSSGQYAQAVAEFDRALEVRPSSAEAHLGLAETYLENNQPELAQQSYASALELQPKYWRALMGMGDFWFTSGEVDKAIPYYERIIELMPDSESALNNLGAAEFMLGRYQRAESAWQRSLELDPSSVAYSNLATSLYFQGQYENSLPLYHKAVELAPEDYELWGNLGDAYRHSELGAEMARPMYENALKLAKKRLQVNPADTDTLAQMAHYAASVGDKLAAMDYIDRANPEKSKDMVVRFNAATAFAAMGRREQALDFLEGALELGYPTHIAVADANLGALQDMPRFQALTGRSQ